MRDDIARALNQAGANALTAAVGLLDSRLAAAAQRRGRAAGYLPVRHWFETYKLTKGFPELPGLTDKLALPLIDVLGGDSMQAAFQELLAVRLTDAPEVEASRAREVFFLTLTTADSALSPFCPPVVEYYDEEICSLVSRLDAVEPGLLTQIRSETLSARITAVLDAIERHSAALSVRPQPADEASFLASYRRHVLDQHGRLEPPDFERRRRVPVADLYVPPIIYEQDYQQWTAASLSIEPPKFSVWDLASRLDRTVLLGDPGCGKTTATNALMHYFASDGARRIPFLVTLRDYAANAPPERSVAGYIENRLATHYQCPPPPGLVDMLLLAGRAVILFDGLDELLDTSRRADVTSRIEHFCQEYPLAPVLITSRIVGYDQARLDEMQFTSYRLAGFRDEDVADYARKWFAQADGARPQDVDAFLAESWVVPDLRTNPLMLSLMCILYRGAGSFPRNRAETYRQCADLLLRNWDARRRIHLELRADHLVEPILCHLAWWLFTRDNSEFTVTEHELVAVTTDFLSERGFESEDDARDSAREFIQFTRGRMWVFSDVGTTATGERLYAFTYRTFLEYFAASQLAYSSDSPESLARALAPHIARGEWDVVGELAIQIKDKTSQDGARRIYEVLLNEYTLGSATNRSNIVKFLARIQESAEQVPSETRGRQDLEHPDEGGSEPGFAERQALADDTEADAQDALGRQSFDEAVPLLLDAIRQDPARAERLQPDLDCLSAQPGDSPGKLAWRRGLWLALAATSPLELTRTHSTYAAVPTADTVAAPAAQAAPEFIAKPVTRKPQQAGADLELAFIKLLERFFSLAAEDEVKILKRLRRQRSGTQYGHDAQFDCATTANHLVRCHVECKNYTRELKPADISEKIIQTQAYWERKEIDYFLIVTPRAGISNDLDHYIQTMNAQGALPFQIQVWGPEEGIEEFFAIEPAAYRKIYGTEPPPVDTESVVASWSAKLKPLLRLPPTLRDYLTNPRLHSLVGEDDAHFDTLSHECVEANVVNAAGLPVGTLRDVLSNWIDDPQQRRFLLLGEFGDGKSFACYRLTRLLARAYLDNPAAVHFALRLPLRDFISAGNPQELLSRRLQALGADMRDWARIQDIGPTLVILDGFDEMSPQLDHATVANNLRLLADCVRYFAGSKLLVTSRTHFFENSRMQDRFLEELGQPEVARMAQLPLSSRITYLHAYAEREGLSSKFERIRRLYDPIGLAAKPLFLQMIKETLPRLPDDHFDEIVLYETSVRDSLERKRELLLDEGMHTLRKEATEGMLQLLESVAVELLKNGGQPVDLRTFGKGKLDIARVLWKMSEVDAGPTQTEDARARLGMRSLLRPFPDEGDSGVWPVAFCHRSMSEYFVAQALVRVIRNGDPLARDLLSTVILRPEIVDFAGLLMNKADDAAALARTLAALARTAVKDTRPGYLGGNAITLAYRIRHRPDDPGWARLDLSYADLSGADLAGADFSDSLLRYATLDNADLTDADLTKCDLTGARIEETAPVISVAPGRQEGSVVACYGDGTIREWELGGSRPTPRKLLDGLGALRSAAWGPYGDLIVLVGPRLSLWTITADEGTRNDAFRVRGGVEHVRFTGGAVSFAQTDENQRIAVSIDCEGATVTAGLQLTQPGPVAFAADQTAVLTTARDHLAVANSEMRKPVPVTVSAADVTALDLRHDEPGPVHLVVGDGEGQVTAVQVPFDGDPQAAGAEATLRLHSGPVLSATFLSQSLVATGGTDRSLIVCEWDDGQLRTLNELKLTLRCSGVKIVGVQGDRERRALEALRDSAEELPGGSRA